MGHRPSAYHAVATKIPTEGGAWESLATAPGAKGVSGFDDLDSGTVGAPSLPDAPAGAVAGARDGWLPGRSADRTPPRLGRTRRCSRPVLDRCAWPGLAGAGTRRFRQRPGPCIRFVADHAAGRRCRGLVPLAVAGRHG